jgi:hypothetical protein
VEAIRLLKDINRICRYYNHLQNMLYSNCLSLLQAGPLAYVLNAGALAYLTEHKLLPAKLKGLPEDGQRFASSDAWEAYLTRGGICAPRHRVIATEGALVGSLLASGFSETMGIVSDDMPGSSMSSATP